MNHSVQADFIRLRAHIFRASLHYLSFIAYFGPAYIYIYVDISYTRLKCNQINVENGVKIQFLSQVMYGMYHIQMFDAMAIITWVD